MTHRHEDTATPDLFADPAALRRGADREHAEVAMTVLVGDVAAGQQPPALFGQELVGNPGKQQPANE